MKPIRNNNVDFLRGVAILFVIFGHTMTGCTLRSEDSFLFNIIWSLQMPLFFLISGYVTRYSHSLESGADLLRYVRKRTASYVLPWIVWTFVIRGILMGQRDYLDLSYILWHMDAGYWFLCSIWMVNLCYGVAEYGAGRFRKRNADALGKLKRAMGKGTVYVLEMVLLLLAGLVLGMNFLCIKLTLYYMVFYFAGALFGEYQEFLFSGKHRVRLMQGLIMACLAVWLLILTRVNLFRAEGAELLLLVAGNYLATVLLTSACVRLVGRSRILRKALFAK